MTMTPTPPNAGEPFGWLTDFYGDGAYRFDLGAERTYAEHRCKKSIPVYTHPQPNAGVVTEHVNEAREFLRRMVHPMMECNASEEAVSLMSEAARHLDIALSAAPKPECTIVHSEDPSAPAYLAHGAVKVTRERCG